MKRHLATVGLLIGVALVLHFAWESLHVGLYGGYEHLTPLPITVWATIGDVAYTIAVYLFLVAIRRDGAWLEQGKRRDYAFLMLAGFGIAVFVEYKAFVLGRWFYLDAMPIIPGLGVGLSPVLQMTVLLPLSFFLTRLLMRRRG